VTIKERIKKLADADGEFCISTRRHLHAHPELSFHEVETSSYIRKMLLSMGLTDVSVIGDTGVVAAIKGKKEGRTILLRADTDALPIQENTGLPFQSTTSGVMHACGHDAHTAMLLSAGKILMELRAEFEGTVRILFQPAEETPPGGAVKMIAAGVLDNPKVDKAIGQHVMPRMPVGKVGIRSGKFMASSDNFRITVRGRGGHAAMPENLIDPVVITGNIIVSLQQLVSRNGNPRIPSVLSIGKVTALGSYNVIPDEVTLEGTFRTMDQEWRERALAQIKKLVGEIAESMGGECTFELTRGYPYLHNNELLAADLKKSIVEYVGAENVVDEDAWMAAEDFAYYSHQVPSVFYLLGIRNESEGITSGLHTPTFKIDEDALPLGAGLMAWLAYQQLVNVSDNL
jgi:amidohydrolase